MSDDKRRTLLESLSKGIAYTVPVIVLATGGSALHAIYADTATESGYQMMAEGEAEGEAEAEG
ncbi:hypothetical protein [Halomonas sp. LBP4]|uniref:hypothetical protein n=1 Tax=Halomonas sp. LBP4 TaxID=2044917 RepID=UPI000D75FD6D|nr:hypothetical protein [Halomonas sp. LBP4]PXX99983.1 hypothetical protein CR157_04285 [Halomonas sp. LBP4]